MVPPIWLRQAADWLEAEQSRFEAVEAIIGYTFRSRETLRIALKPFPLGAKKLSRSRYRQRRINHDHAALRQHFQFRYLALLGDSVVKITLVAAAGLRDDEHPWYKNILRLDSNHHLSLALVRMGLPSEYLDLSHRDPKVHKGMSVVTKASILEALVGAIFWDGDYEKARDFVVRIVVERH